jgi:tRNA1Val (adenine37-N6)-methyltransferase
MASRPFLFKKFEVNQKGVAHPVGTDSILLGAWAPGNESGPMLDIGTGTGVIALMLAQRFDSGAIVGIDLHADSVVCAQGNFQASPWPSRLTAQHVRLQEYTPNQSFNLISCNPPFFDEEILAPDEHRSRARSTTDLSHVALLENVKRLLSSNGVFSCILPPIAAQGLIETAQQLGLYPYRICRVHSRPNKPVERVMMAFGKKLGSCTEEHLILHAETGLEPSEAFRQLAADFYLNW